MLTIIWKINCNFDNINRFHHSKSILIERMLLKRGMGNGEWGMGNGEWGMGNGEWGMGMGNGE